MENELAKLQLPSNFKLVITGGGRVAGGALEVIAKTNIQKYATKQNNAKKKHVSQYNVNFLAYLKLWDHS